MKRSTLPSLISLVCLVVALPVAAQQNELGLFVSMSSFDSTTFEDPDAEADGSIEFEEQVGFGVSYNRYWTDQLSIEFAAQRMDADAEFTFRDAGTDVSFDLGTVELTALTGTLQWHFGDSASRFVPYLGGGVAHVTGSIDIADEFRDPGDPETEDFESEVTWLANAGIDFRISDALSIGVDGKYIAYDATPETEVDEGEESIDLNPLIVAATLKFRF